MKEPRYQTSVALNQEEKDRVMTLRGQGVSLAGIIRIGLMTIEKESAELKEKE